MSFEFKVNCWETIFLCKSLLYNAAKLAPKCFSLNSYNILLYIIYIIILFYCISNYLFYMLTIIYCALVNIENKSCYNAISFVSVSILKFTLWFRSDISWKYITVYFLSIQRPNSMWLLNKFDVICVWVFFTCYVMFLFNILHMYLC